MTDRDAKLDELEDHLIRQIEMLKQAYMEAAKPYVDELEKLRRIRPRPVFLGSGVLMHKLAEIMREQESRPEGVGSAGPAI